MEILNTLVRCLARVVDIHREEFLMATGESRDYNNGQKVEKRSWKGSQENEVQ